MFEQVVYVSKALPGIDASGVYDIVRVSNNRNSQFGLTGMLIHLDGYFLQVLEGEARVLRQRFDYIRGDMRHTDVEVRRYLPQAELSFPEEWMSLRDGAAIDDSIKEAFGYLPGFPVARFDADKLVFFALACYRPYRPTAPATI